MQITANLGELVPVLDKAIIAFEKNSERTNAAVKAALGGFNTAANEILTIVKEEHTACQKRREAHEKFDLIHEERQSLEDQIRIIELKQKLELMNDSATLAKIAELKKKAAIDAAEAEASVAANKLAAERNKAEVLEAKKKELLSRLPKMDNFELE